MVGIWIIVLFVFALLFYKFVFLRDPVRESPPGRNIVSPADGKIIKIVRLEQKVQVGISKGLLGRIRAAVPSECKNGFLVTIMMNLLDVHVQRVPISGRVVVVRHNHGKFLNAVYGNSFENGWSNENNEVIINSNAGPVKVIQIAGFLARRIVCFVKKNDKVNKGDKLGKILLGSQVCLIVPKVKLAVAEGNRVRAGETIIAKF